MQTKILANGNLCIKASHRERKDLEDARKRRGYYGVEGLVAEGLHEVYDFVNPIIVGALTNSPILCASDDIDSPDQGTSTPRPGAKVYWFPDYQIIDPWELLIKRGIVIFAAASE